MAEAAGFEMMKARRLLYLHAKIHQKNQHHTDNNNHDDALHRMTLLSRAIIARRVKKNDAPRVGVLKGQEKGGLTACSGALREMVLHVKR